MDDLSVAASDKKMITDRYLLYSVMAALVAIINLALAVVVIRSNPKSITNRSFAFISVCLASWPAAMSVAYLARETGKIVFWTKLSYLGPAIIPPVFYIFVKAFPNKELKLNYFHWPVLFLPSFILEGLFFTNWAIQGVVFKPWGLHFIVGWVIPVYALFYIIYMAICFGVMLKKYKTETGLVKLQVQYLLFSVYLLAAICILCNLILPSFGNCVFTQFGSVASIILVGTVAYSIVKHRLMDITVVIRKSLVYAIIVGLFTGAYLAVIFIMSIGLQVFTGQSSAIIAISLMLIFALAFQPLRNRAQNWVDRLFFREKHNYQKVIRELSATLANATDLTKLVNQTTTRVKSLLKTDNCSVYLLERERYKLKE